MVTAAEFWEVASIFSSSGLSPKSQATVERFLGYAEDRVARDVWGSKADQGVIYLAAHLLTEDHILNSTPIVSPTSASGAGYAGAITSESMGPLSRSFGAGTGLAASSGAGAFNDEALATTGWGKRFVALRSELLVQGVSDGFDSSSGL